MKVYGMGGSNGMILSKSFLTSRAERRNISEYGDKKEQILYENANLSTRFDSVNKRKIKQYDIFLSHSSLDKRLVITLVDLFNEAGYSVYVDWIEDTQIDRSNVNKNTAQVLQGRMNDSKGLSYVATSNSTNSKWCPWELGYFDGKKRGRCCILPIIESQTFHGQEYLGLYPYLEYAKYSNQNRYEFWVNNQDGEEYITLRGWLDGKEPYKH
jgi:hypothetical protein